MKHLAALALIVCFPLPVAQAAASAGENIENRHPLLNHVCKDPVGLDPSDDLLSHKRRAIEGIVWKGKDLRSWTDLSTAAMGDVRVKLQYFKALVPNNAKRAEVEEIFQQKRAELLSMPIDASMRQALRHVRLVSFEKFLERDLEGMSTFFLGWKSRGHHLELACGANGLALSAFYYHPDKAVVMCPGTEMRLALNELHVSSLDFLIAHEIGHALDTKSFPDFYRQIKEEWEIHPVFLNESAADYWAAKTLVSASLNHLRKNLGLMCGLPEVSFGSFPYRSGYQRINFILHQSSERF